MIRSLTIFLGKLVGRVSRQLNLGSGSTWPGHIALFLSPYMIENLLARSKTQIILVVGTNGKTTTATMLTTILRKAGKKVIQNTSGANLLNGIATTLILHANPTGTLRAEYAVFEVDENNLPIALTHLTPTCIIALNLFRDQLDRYGELDTIAKKWNSVFKKLPYQTTLILNSDDPLIAYLAKDVTAPVVYFGLPQKAKGQKAVDHAADSIYCPNCGHKLSYKTVFYSHLGIWHCLSCGVKRPLPTKNDETSPLPGTYNLYNTLAATLAAHTLGIDNTTITNALKDVEPVFGRQEVLSYKGKNIQIFLSKNPTSFNESLRTITDIENYSSNEVRSQSEDKSSRSARTIKSTILIVLNDRIPDGRDISWIWDINIEKFIGKFGSIVISGDRTYDMALRISYAMQFPIVNFEYPNKNTKNKMSNIKCSIEPNLKLAIGKALDLLPPEETLFILPTYSAMLEVRKILTGRKIL